MGAVIILSTNQSFSHFVPAYPSLTSPSFLLPPASPSSSLWLVDGVRLAASSCLIAFAKCTRANCAFISVGEDICHLIFGDFLMGKPPWFHLLTHTLTHTILQSPKTWEEGVSLPHKCVVVCYKLDFALDARKVQLQVLFATLVAKLELQITLINAFRLHGMLNFGFHTFQGLKNNQIMKSRIYGISGW